MSITDTFVQRPSFLWVPEATGTIGDEVNDFADVIGIPRDPVQRLDIDVINSFGPDGRWLTLETCDIEGRQNGKTKAVYLPTILFRFFIRMKNDPDRIFWTSHLMKTTNDSFNVVCMLIEENPMLSRRVKKIRYQNDDKGIDLINGAVLDFIARSEGGGRGLSGAEGFFDEALFLKATFMGALLPTMSSRDNPRIHYASSPGKQGSTQLQALQKRGRAGGDPSLTYLEYTAQGGWDDPPCENGVKCTHIVDDPKAAGCSFDNPKYWRQANHAIGVGRMRETFVAAERRSLCQTPEGVIEFGCERMGWTESISGVPDPDGIAKTNWLATESFSTSPVDEVVISVDIPPSGDRAAIGVAGLNSDEMIHFGVIDYRMGTAWVVKRLAELQDKHNLMCGIMWQPDAPVGALKNQLELEGVRMYDVTAQEFSKACGAFKNHVMDGDCQRRPSELLDKAFGSAERRISVEGSWRWDRRKGGEDISPLIVCTMAVHGVDLFARRDPHVLSF